MTGYHIKYDFKRVYSLQYTINVISDAWPKGHDPPKNIEHGGWEWTLANIDSRFGVSRDAMLIRHIMASYDRCDILILLSQGREKVAVYRKVRTYIPPKDDVSVYRDESGKPDTRFDRPKKG